MKLIPSSVRPVRVLAGAPLARLLVCLLICSPLVRPADAAADSGLLQRASSGDVRAEISRTPLPANWGGWT